MNITKWYSGGQKESVWLFAAATAAKSLQSCPTLCDPIDSSPPGSPVPGILQAHWRGCHFLLQCMKVWNESEVAQPCPTLSHPMDCSPPGSSVHGISQARVLEWSAIAFSGYMSLDIVKTILSTTPHLEPTHSVMVLHELMLISEKAMAPTPVLLPGKSHGQRSLVGCSPWGR